MRSISEIRFRQQRSHTGSDGLARQSGKSSLSRLMRYNASRASLMASSSMRRSGIRTNRSKRNRIAFSASATRAGNVSGDPGATASR